MRFSELHCSFAAVRSARGSNKRHLDILRPLCLKEYFLVKQSLSKLQRDPVVQFINMPYIYSG